MDDFQPFFEIIDRLGTIGALALLAWQNRRDFLRERDEHHDTRKEYREDLQQVAGIRASLAQKQPNLQEIPD